MSFYTHFNIGHHKLYGIVALPKCGSGPPRMLPVILANLAWNTFSANMYLYIYTYICVQYVQQWRGNHLMLLVKVVCFHA